MTQEFEWRCHARLEDHLQAAEVLFTVAVEAQVGKLLGAIPKPDGSTLAGKFATVPYVSARAYVERMADDRGNGGTRFRQIMRHVGNEVRALCRLHEKCSMLCSHI